MDTVSTCLLKDILYASRNRLLTVSNEEYEIILKKIEIFLENDKEKKNNN